MTLAPEATSEPSQRASTTTAWSVDAAEVSAEAKEALRAPPRSLLAARSPDVAPLLLGMVVAKAGPEGLTAGETWKAEFTVLRHGVTPTDGAAPSVTIRDERRRSETFAAVPTGETGAYVAHVLFPGAGRWDLEIDNGLAATGYGVSAITTYAPVTIEPPHAGGDSGVPALPLGLLAAVVLGVRSLPDIQRYLRIRRM